MKKFNVFFLNAIYMLVSVWRFSRSLFWGKLILSILSGILAPLNAYVLKVLVDRITERNWNYALVMVCTFVVVNFVNGVISSFVKKKIGISEDLFRNYLFFEFYAKTVSLDYELLFDPDMQQKKEMAMKTVRENRAIKYLDIVFALISRIITLVSVIYLLSVFPFWVYIVLCSLCFVKILSVVVSKKSTFRITNELVPLNTKINYYINMLTDESYANDMRMYSIAYWVIFKYEKCVNLSHDLLKKLLNTQLNASLVQHVLTASENAFVYIFAAVQMIFFDMSFANFTLITSTLRTFSDAISGITGNLIDIGENSAYVQIFREFMKVENKIAVKGKGEDISTLTPTEPVFDFSDVSFRYPGAEADVLSGVDLKLEGGKFYVMVGRNGAGKTTLTRLICRLYDVSQGTLKYMNRDIRELEYSSYRNNIGIVFQDYKSYSLSIAENVAMNAYSEDEAVQKKILDAIETAGLGDKIRSLPKGINTQLGKIFDKEGIQLSGGELQKLALAKVLFQNPDIVILDEPSSALDAFAEDELIKTFNSALKGKTVIYISHRLSVAKYADRVIYMDGGKIAGFDSHEKLLNTVDTYRYMYEAQARHYTDGEK